MITNDRVLIWDADGDGYGDTNTPYSNLYTTKWIGDGNDPGPMNARNGSGAIIDVDRCMRIDLDNKTWKLNQSFNSLKHSTCIYNEYTHTNFTTIELDCDGHTIEGNETMALFPSNLETRFSNFDAGDIKNLSVHDCNLKKFVIAIRAGYGSNVTPPQLERYDVYNNNISESYVAIGLFIGNITNEK